MGRVKGEQFGLKGHMLSTTLDDYALGRLSPADEEIVETHILVCPKCQNNLALRDQLISALRWVN